jgi:glycosyltransferase involved in cell wall biosynthesis
VRLFHPDAILAVPLRVASGIRMKILEAWARGTPVVATPEAIRGLDQGGDDGVLLARDAGEFASAVEQIRARSGLAADLVAAGRRQLVRRHDPERVTASLAETYRAARVG